MPPINEVQSKATNRVVILLIIVIIGLIVAVVFGIWAYAGRQDYKNNTDKKITVAVVVAQKKQIAVDATSYAVAEEKPLLTYDGPLEYGSLVVEYPKTWSAYVAVASADENSSTPVNGYFQPGVVSDVQNTANTFALRVQVLQQTYDQVLQALDSQAQNGQAIVTPYALPKVPSVIGVKVNGTIGQNIRGTMVVLPLRTTTLEISTESADYETDFNNVILPNFSFSP